MTPLVTGAFLLGFLGASHCVTMCGGFAALGRARPPSDEPHVAATKLVRSNVAAHAGSGSVRLMLAQNAGRIATYASLGMIVGTLGGALGHFATRGQAVLEIVSAFLLVGVGLFLVGLLPSYALLERAGVPLFRSVQPIARRVLPLRTATQATVFGAVWGLLPCGLVYSALGIAAVSGSAARGGLVMLAFGAGTLPALIAMGVLADSVARFAQMPLVRRGAGVMLLVFGAIHLALATSRF